MYSETFDFIRATKNMLRKLEDSTKGQVDGVGAMSCEQLATQNERIVTYNSRLLCEAETRKAEIAQLISDKQVIMLHERQIIYDRDRARKERDEALAEVERLRLCEQKGTSGRVRLEDANKQLREERDKARAEVERLKNSWQYFCHRRSTDK